MASILTDHILDKLLCSTCKQYLSCGPTKLYRNGSISCGRCNTDENAYTNSFHDKVSNHLLFPCINRYEGCNKLLQFKDVSQHEKVCIGTKFSCPLCPFDPSNQVTLLFLIDHYKSAHGEYFLEEPKFFIDPKVMSEYVYLYCDNANNCVFLIKVSCTQDRLTLNACVPEKNTVSQRFRLNNILELPIKEVVCNSWEKEENQYLQVNILSGEDEQILCEFLYEILENKTSIVVIDLNSIDEPNRDGKFRKLPKFYFDKNYFTGYNTYTISPCGSKLICENDPTIVIQMKCDFCDTYFWNVSFEPMYQGNKRCYGLYSACLVNRHLLVCLKCHKRNGSEWNNLLDARPMFNSPILNLKVYCRYNCGIICCIWDIHDHEQNCDFNFEKDTETFITTWFNNKTFNDDDKFVRGNCIESFEFEVAYYTNDSGWDGVPIIPKDESFISQERIIYGVTDDGYKFKVYYKYAEGKFTARVKHDYDPFKYVVIIRWLDPCCKMLKKMMCSEQSNYRIFSTELKLNRKSDRIGTNLTCTFPSFFIIIKKKSQFTSIL